MMHCSFLVIYGTTRSLDVAYALDDASPPLGLALFSPIAHVHRVSTVLNTRLLCQSAALSCAVVSRVPGHRSVGDSFPHTLPSNALRARSTRALYSTVVVEGASIWSREAPIQAARGET